MLLAAGELIGIGVTLVRQPHGLEQGHGPLLGGLFIHTLHLHRGQHDVVQHRLVGEEVELLEHHAHAQQKFGALLGRSGDQIGAVVDDAAAGGLFQQIQTPQEGGFAAAGGADDGHHLTGLDLDIYALENLVLAEGLSQALYADHAHFSYPRK